MKHFQREHISWPVLQKSWSSMSEVQLYPTVMYICFFLNLCPRLSVSSSYFASTTQRNSNIIIVVIAAILSMLTNFGAFFKHTMLRLH